MSYFLTKFFQQQQISTLALGVVLFIRPLMHGTDHREGI